MRAPLSIDPWLFSVLGSLFITVILAGVIYLRSDAFYFLAYGRPVTVEDSASNSSLRLTLGRSFEFDGVIFQRGQSLSMDIPFFGEPLVLISKRDYETFQKHYEGGKACPASFLRSAAHLIMPVGSREHLEVTKHLSKGQHVRLLGDVARVDGGSFRGMQIVPSGGVELVVVSDLQILG